MSFQNTEQLRHAEERGRILQVLQSEYGRGAVTAHTLLGALDALNYPMTLDSLQFSLTYLADSNYIAVTRASETPGYRKDRPGSLTPYTIVTARVLPLGIQLIDGQAPADVGVRF